PSINWARTHSLAVIHSFHYILLTAAFFSSDNHSIADAGAIASTVFGLLNPVISALNQADHRILVIKNGTTNTNGDIQLIFRKALLGDRQPYFFSDLNHFISMCW